MEKVQKLFYWIAVFCPIILTSCDDDEDGRKNFDLNVTENEINFNGNAYRPVFRLLEDKPLVLTDTLEESQIDINDPIEDGINITYDSFGFTFSANIDDTKATPTNDTIAFDLETNIPDTIQISFQCYSYITIDTVELRHDESLIPVGEDTLFHILDEFEVNGDVDRRIEQGNRDRNSYKEEIANELSDELGIPVENFDNEQNATVDQRLNDLIDTFKIVRQEGYIAYANVTYGNGTTLQSKAGKVTIVQGTGNLEYTINFNIEIANGFVLKGSIAGVFESLVDNTTL